MSGPERRTRLYWATSHWRNRLLRLINDTFTGLWLGLMDRETLDRLDEEYWRRVSEPVGDGSAQYAEVAWLERGLFGWESDVVARHFPAGGRIVVTGAGSGREVLALRDAGFDAVGYEPNATLVESGRRMLAERGHANVLHVVERDVFPAQESHCDGVVIGWGSYTLIPARALRIDLLQQARASLPEGGPILLSFFLRRRDVGAPERVARIGSAVRLVRRAPAVEVGDMLSPLYVHRFDRSEVESELAAAGFELLSFDTQPYGHAVGRALSSS